MMWRLAPDALRDVRALDVPGAPASARVTSDPYRADRAHLAALLIEALSRTPACIADIVAQALPRFREAREIKLHLHPADRALLPAPALLREAHALRGSLVLVDDATLTRGGCLLQAAEGALDARVETRVDQLLTTAEACA